MGKQCDINDVSLTLASSLLVINSPLPRSRRVMTMRQTDGQTETDRQAERRGRVLDESTFIHTDSRADAQQAGKVIMSDTHPVV